MRVRVLEEVKKEFEENRNIMIAWTGEYRRRLRFNKKCKRKRIVLDFMKYFKPINEGSDKE